MVVASTLAGALVEASRIPGMVARPCEMPGGLGLVWLLMPLVLPVMPRLPLLVLFWLLMPLILPVMPWAPAFERVRGERGQLGPGPLPLPVGPSGRRRPSGASPSCGSDRLIGDDSPRRRSAN